MKIFYKILASVLLFSSIFMTFMMGAILTSEGINVFSPYIDTQFAPQYSPEKFELIKVGQSIKDVEAIVGKPLRKTMDSTVQETQYWYTMDSKLHFNKKSGDFAWYVSIVYFDSDRYVKNIVKQWAYD